MVDINVVVANNIADQMKKTGTKQIELANAIGVKKQVMSKMLNGSRMINISELRRIADFFHVSTDAAREALHTVDELADMIIYHANVRENARAMSETWEM